MHELLWQAGTYKAVLFLRWNYVTIKKLKMIVANQITIVWVSNK